METLLITRNINNRKTYGCDINYSKGWFIKTKAKDKYNPKVSSSIPLASETNESNHVQQN